METTGSISKIDSIIYFDDFEDLVKYNPEDLTPDQRRFGWIRLDISSVEIKRILGLIDACQDFKRIPSEKHKTFVSHIKHLVDLEQTDIENILHSLHNEVFCRGCYSTDTNTRKKTFLKFEFYNTRYKFSSGKTLSKFEYPLVIYIEIAENLRTNKAVALVSFTSYDYEKRLLAYIPKNRVNLNYIKKVGTVYIVSVVTKPYAPEDPFFEFYISESTYDKITHLIEALTIPMQCKYPLQYRCEPYGMYTMYRSLDPIRHSLPIPLKYFYPHL